MRIACFAALASALAGTFGCSASHDAGTVADAGPGEDASGRADSGPPRSDAGPEPLCHGRDGCSVAEVVACLFHVCVRLESGTVGCWGSNQQGQLVRAGLESSPRALRVEGAPAFVRFIAGNAYACGVAGGGAIWCWGTDTDGLYDATGGPSTGWLSRVPDAADFARGVAHVCAIRNAGDVTCWGFRGGDGQLGIGSRAIVREPTLVPGIDRVVELALGALFSCARTSSGRVACWGDNAHGQVGDGTGGTDGSAFDRLSPVFILDAIRRLSAGGDFACALSESGEVSCWGDNTRGQVGTDSHGLAVPAPSRVRFPLGEIIIDVAAGFGGMHACALAASGRVFCWGDNGSGQLGYGGGSPQSFDPVSVAGIDDATALALGSAFSCAIRRSGELWCWGHNDEGQLGDGTLVNRSEPVRVVGLW